MDVPLQMTAGWCVCVISVRTVREVYSVQRPRNGLTPPTSLFIVDFAPSCLSYAHNEQTVLWETFDKQSMLYNLIKELFGLVDPEMSTLFSQSFQLAISTPGFHISLSQLFSSLTARTEMILQTLDTRHPTDATASPSTFYYIKILFFQWHPNYKSAHFSIQVLYICGPRWLSG